MNQLNTPNPEFSRKDKSEETIQTKSQLLNPAWSEEVVANFGIAGSISKEIAGHLATAIAKDIQRSWNRPRIAKLIRKATIKTIR